MAEQLEEPWLRGPLEGVNPLLMPVLHSLTQAREDLHRHTRGVRDERLWSRPWGLTSLGFHLRHIGGSLNRLTIYLQGGELNPREFAFMLSESRPGATISELLSGVDRAIDCTSEVVRTLDPCTLTDPRSVGRKQLPTTVIGLAVHLAEHTQRHVGQAITLCHLLKAIQPAPCDP